MNYFDGYFDALEAVPLEAQRAFSMLREVDSLHHRTHKALNEKLREFLSLDAQEEDPASREGRLRQLHTLFTRDLKNSEDKRQAAIRMDLSLERLLKRTTMNLEKIEELFLDRAMEEQEEKDFVDQHSTQQAQTALQDKSKKGLQAKGKPSIGYPSGHVVSSPPATASSSTAASAPSSSPPSSQTAATAQVPPNGSSGGGKQPPPSSAPAAQGGASSKKRKEQPSAQASGAAKKTKTNAPTYFREDLYGSLPTYTGRNPCPPLCGPNPASPDYILKKGDHVAARTSKPKDPNAIWILATVVRHHAGRNRYEVEDVEEEEMSDGKNAHALPTRKKYTLNADAIIPLPKWLPDPSKKLEFSVDKKVLALYPGTTCFYEAIVIAPPSKRRKENDYLVQFEDDEESEAPLKAVPQMYVLNMPAPSSP